MRRALLALQIALVVLAAAAFAIPIPPRFIERYYADWWYPWLQSHVTRWSNTSGVSLSDVLAIVLLVSLATVWIRSLRQGWRQRRVRPLRPAFVVSVVMSATLYLWFLGAWGFNYAREPIETTIGFDDRRVTPTALRQLADRATAAVNTTHAAAHAAGFPGASDTPAALVVALHAVERRLGRPIATVPGRPKQTLLAPFFRASGVDGMHAPFLLETLLNPDLTPPERPAVLAHEWAHLSGHAAESDASFVGLLTALGADAPSRYSAWLRLFDEVVAQLPVDEQRRHVAGLEPGPQADRRAVRDRLTARVEVVADVSWRTYDQYLKSQGVSEGLASYSRVVQLVLGSGALEWR